MLFRSSGGRNKLEQETNMHRSLHENVTQGQERLDLTRVSRTRQSHGGVTRAFQRLPERGGVEEKRTNQSVST